MNSTDGPRFEFMYCLPAFHHPDTTVDHEIMEHTGMTSGREVTDEGLETAASIVFDQAGDPAPHHQGNPGGDARQVTKEGYEI